MAMKVQEFLRQLPELLRSQLTPSSEGSTSWALLAA